MIPVWFGGKKVGVLNLSAPADRNVILYKETCRDGISESDFAISLTTRHHEICRRNVVESGQNLEFICLHQIGVSLTSAKIVEDIFNDSYRISWRVVQAMDLDEYERLFDLPIFYPE